MYLGRALPICYNGYLVGLSIKLWVIILANILAELSMSAETELILFKCFIILCYLELTSIFTHFFHWWAFRCFSVSWHYKQCCYKHPVILLLLCRCLSISLRSIPQEKISRSQNMNIFKLKPKGCPFLMTPIYAVTSWAWCAVSPYPRLDANNLLNCFPAY